MNSSISKTAYNPDYVSPPGETLQETLAMLGLSQAELADRTGRPKKTINEIIRGKTLITPETALQLERVLNIPAAFWMNRESKYRAWIARQEEDQRLEEEIHFLEKLPIKEMIKYGWIDSRSKKLLQLKELLSFFGVVSASKIPQVEQIAFRASKTYQSDPWHLAAWLRKGEVEANKINSSSYDQNKFENLLKWLRKLTDENIADFVPEMIKKCADVGVTVVFVHELSKTKISGATRWLSPNKPVMQLCLRYKTNDQIWFTFFHEAAHICLGHGKKEIFFETKNNSVEDQREVAASELANSLLISKEFWQEFTTRHTYTDSAIKAFAKAQGIAAGIVVGRLQHEKRIQYSQGYSLKKKYSWDDLNKIGFAK